MSFLIIKTIKLIAQVLLLKFVTSIQYPPFILFLDYLVFQIKEKSAEKQKTPSKREFRRPTCNDGPVVECLLDLILTKTNRHFGGLCEGLERTNQGFIVKQFLSKQGKKRKFILMFYVHKISKDYSELCSTIFNFILAVEKATKNLQEALSEYYSGSYTDSMFTYDPEEHRVDLSEIYVPIKWVTREKSAEGVTEKKLENYQDVFHQVSLVVSYMVENAGCKILNFYKFVNRINIELFFFQGIRWQTCKSHCKRRTCLRKNYFCEKGVF